jgi:hypothetical protein
MKNIWSLVLLTMVVSCGNPHISSVKSGLERSNPPLTACSAPEVDVSDYRFFVSSGDPTDYMNFMVCRNATHEDFNIFSDGSVPELSNNGRADFPYILTHRSEIKYDSEKVVHLEEIFGTSTYDIAVQNPVTNSGDVSVDRGVDSGSVDNISNDAFVWKFSSPISFWSAHPVGLKNNSTLRIFNCSEDLVNEVQITGSPKFIGFISAFENICYVSLSAADGNDSVSVDDFEYGR